jgi:hypothetical protein
MLVPTKSTTIEAMRHIGTMSASSAFDVRQTMIKPNRHHGLFV